MTPLFTSTAPEQQSNGLWRIVVNGQVFFYEWYSVAIAHLEMCDPYAYNATSDDAARLLRTQKHH